MGRCKCGGKCCSSMKLIKNICLVIVLLAAIDIGITGIWGKSMISSLPVNAVQAVNIIAGIAALFIIFIKVMKRIKGKGGCGHHDDKKCTCKDDSASSNDKCS